MADKLKIKFIADPGHGWLQVHRGELVKYGIEAKISSFSYQHGETVYLEEDCDAAHYLNALKADGIDVEFIEVFQDPTPIRNYPSYTH